MSAIDLLLKHGPRRSTTTVMFRKFPHPRSRQALEAIARRWGSGAGFAAAEAFELIRSLRA